MILINLCSLLNYNSDEIFKKDYNFLMKVLANKEHSNADNYIKQKSTKAL